jgi:hypothetical protein
MPVDKVALSSGLGSTGSKQDALSSESVPVQTSLIKLCRRGRLQTLTYAIFLTASTLSAVEALSDRIVSIAAFEPQRQSHRAWRRKRTDCVTD